MEIILNIYHSSPQQQGGAWCDINLSNKYLVSTDSDNRSLKEIIHVKGLAQWLVCDKHYKYYQGNIS